jgi:hypothetical protein
MTQTTDMRPWLIGEMNPHQKPGEDPSHKFDLYPLPRGASGHRLCKLVLGMEMTTYLRSFIRRDLLIAKKWSVPQARKAASAVWAESKGAPLILLGAKVSAAFGFAYEPFTFVKRDAVVGDRRILIIPHPSGLCRAWDEPLAFRRARELVLPLLAAVEATCST